MTMTRRTALAAALALAGATAPGVATAAPPAAARPVAMTAASTAAARPTLRPGSTGPAVTDLQKRLRAKGFDVLATGRYDATTRAAVAAFQRSTGLDADGVAGPDVWGVLLTDRWDPEARRPYHPTIRQGWQGPVVYELQRRLGRTGVVGRVTVDAVFGPGTRSAVVAFQRTAHLTADGVVGPRTWAALVAASRR